MESSSVQSFIKRMIECEENTTSDISIDEIKMVISKNPNNFQLIIRAVSYLFNYWLLKQDSSVSGLIIEYCERAIAIYQYDKELNITIDDIKKVIALTYSVKKDYETTKKYIEENNLSNANYLLAESEFELGNYESALKILSNDFLNSVNNIFNANRIQINVLIKSKEYQEAYELTNWTLSFLDSIKKEKHFLSVLNYGLVFLKACLEKVLGLNYDESVKYLKNNYQLADNNGNNSESLKFYYDKKINFTVIVSKDIKTEIFEDVEKFKDNPKVYQEFMFIFNQVYKEE